MIIYDASFRAWQMPESPSPDSAFRLLILLSTLAGVLFPEHTSGGQTRSRSRATRITDRKSPWDFGKVNPVREV
jgi:hypothetical protein